MKHWIPQLYGAPKLHKKKINGQYQFRLILSKYGSPLEIASKWIDVRLQSIEIKTRLKDVFKLLHELEKVKLQPNTKYHTNMDIQDTLETLEKYFKTVVQKEKVTFNINLLLEVTKIILKSNILMFGDLFQKQIKGIAMGTCSAVMLVNIYVAYNK